MLWGRDTRERAAFLKQPLAVEDHILGGAREPSGERLPYESRISSKFAGILQVKIRQRGSGGRMLMSICCERSMTACLSHDPWHNWHFKTHRMLPRHVAGRPASTDAYAGGPHRRYACAERGQRRNIR